ncbi:MAG: type II toxin-antitoxin system VapC family toxin [Acidimicrobiales bacterium]|nr:type II toxin-antitoxin system VapC family toxin [Acidimicrobiales bacterium]
MMKILVVDTSALIFRYLPGENREMVLSLMEDAEVWCASELVRAESLLALHRASISPSQHLELSRLFSSDWDAFHVVPMDGRCVSRAASLGSRFGLKIVDAIHLAAADRLPRPVQYLTFDHRQIPAAIELGLEVLTPAGL